MFVLWISGRHTLQSDRRDHAKVRPTKDQMLLDEKFKIFKFQVGDGVLSAPVLLYFLATEFETLHRCLLHPAHLLHPALGPGHLWP